MAKLAVRQGVSIGCMITAAKRVDNDGNDVPDGADLELQIVGSATPYLNLTQFGFINVSNVDVSLPTPGPDAGVAEETLQPVMV